MSKLNKYEHISFDLDGTLIDSAAVMEFAWNETRKEFNLSPTFEAYRRSTGIPFTNIMENLGVEDELGDIQNFYFSKTAVNLDRILLFDDVIKKIPEFILKQKKTWSIITSKNRNNTLKILDRFNLKPDFLVCGDDMKVGKPHSNSMRMVMENLNLTISNKILYVGDTLTDYIFSINAGVDYIHANYGLHGALSKNILPGCLSINSFDELFD